MIYHLNLKITKVLSRYSDFFSYQKIYFTYNNINMCYKIYNDYFLKKKLINGM